MTPDRRLGWIAILAGVGLALGVQVAAPVGVPLYDGVVVQEPYRYLHPTGSQVNAPTSYSAAPAVVDGVSPQFAAATSESPVQAQLIAQRDAFELPPGTTSLQVSVTPIEPPPAPTGWSIPGNVYRFSVTDQAGTPLPIKRCDGCVSLTLRAPDGVEAATMKRFADGSWNDVETLHAGIVAMYQTNPTVLGDYTVITVAAGGPDPILVVVGTAIVVLILAGAFLLFRTRREPAAPVVRRRGGSSGPGARPGPPRVPSKRRGSRRPPSGRAGE